MPTIDEIKTNYKEQHNTLSEAFYTKKKTVGVTQEEKSIFDQQHGQIWNNMEAELLAEGYIQPPEPPFDVVKEIADLKAVIEKLK